MEIIQIEDYISKHTDGIPQIDPSFWLSGDYAKQQANPTFSVIPIGKVTTEWLYRYCREDPKAFTKSMISFSCLPTEEPDRSRLVRVITIYEKFFAAHGDVMAYSSVDEGDPLYLSPNARDEMSEYAHNVPFMIDVFKAKAQQDLTAGDQRYHSMQAYISTRVGFEPNMFNFIQLFPKIAAEVYNNIEYDNNGLVTNFEILEPSEEFIKLNEHYQLI